MQAPPLIEGYAVIFSGLKLIYRKLCCSIKMRSRQIRISLISLCYLHSWLYSDYKHLDLKLLDTLKDICVQYGVGYGNCLTSIVQSTNSRYINRCQFSVPESTFDTSDTQSRCNYPSSTYVSRNMLLFISGSRVDLSEKEGENDLLVVILTSYITAFTAV